MEGKRRITAVELQLRMTIFLLVKNKIDEGYEDPLTRRSPEWVEVKEYQVKKLELKGDTIVVNEGLESQLNLSIHHKDVFVDKDTAYEHARITNGTLSANLKDIKEEYERLTYKLMEFEEFYKQLEKVKLI